MPRKQGRRPAGIDFALFGVESLFAREPRAYERFYRFNSKSEGKRNNYANSFSLLF